MIDNTIFFNNSHRKLKPIIKNNKSDYVFPVTTKNSSTVNTNLTNFSSASKKSNFSFVKKKFLPNIRINDHS